MTQSFLFGGKKKPLTYEEMMRQRAVSQSLAQPMPTRNLGEGLSAIGRVIGSKMAGSRADKASTALRGDFEKEFQALLGGNMGGSAIQRAVQQRYSPQPTQQQPQESAPGDRLAAGDSRIFDRSIPRSIRTNNPGAMNIAKWQRDFPGFVGTTKDDGKGNVTSAWETPEHGVAAWKHLIDVVYGAGGRPMTVSQIADRYAGGDGSKYVAAWTKSGELSPDTVIDPENNEQMNPSLRQELARYYQIADRYAGVDGSKYVAAWTKSGKLSPDTVIDPENNEQMLALAKGSFGFESGRGQHLSDEQILAGLNMDQQGEQQSAQPQAMPQQAAQMQPASYMAQSQQNSGIDPRLALMMGNPMATPGQKAIMQAMLQRQMSANAPMDPFKQLQMQKMQMEIDKMQNPQIAPTKGVVVNGSVVNPVTGEVIYQGEEDPADRKILKGADGFNYFQDNGDRVLPGVQVPEAEKKQPNSVREFQFAQQNGFGGTYQEFLASKRASTSVTVNNQEGAPANDSALRKALGQKEGQLYSTFLAAGQTAVALNQDLGAIDELIQLAPQGPIQGRLAEMFQGFSSAGDALQSVVKRVAPSLRVEGSGSQSDIEYDGFLRSLPSLKNKPEANRAVVEILRAKSGLDIERAQLIQSYQNNEISVQDVRAGLSDLANRSILTPELKAAIGGLYGPKPTGSAPSGVTDEDWEFMTPEERSLFQ